MKKLTHNEILNERLTEKEALDSQRHPIYVIAHNIRSLYNVGSLFRTCDSALVSGFVMTGFTPHPPRKEIEKTALGAVDSVPWSYEKEIFKAINSFKERNIKVFALELTNEKRQYDSLTQEEFPICIVAGNELTGLDDEVISQCDDAIEIPMFGVKHSLNVSVATGIAIYEALRKWNSFNII